MDRTICAAVITLLVVAAACAPNPAASPPPGDPHELHLPPVGPSVATHDLSFADASNLPGCYRVKAVVSVDATR